MKRKTTLFLSAGFTFCAVMNAASALDVAANPPASAIKGPEAFAAIRPDNPVAVINGKQITAKQAIAMLNLLPEAQRKSLPNLQAALQEIAMLQDLSNKAAAAGMDQQSPVKQQLKLAQDQILSQTYLQHVIDSSNAPVGDAKAYYDAHPSEFNVARLSGIVIGFKSPGNTNTNAVSRTEAEARQKADDLEKKVKAGADVALLARTESDNLPSVAQGGQLGTISEAAPNVAQEIREAAFKQLKPGQVSEPIRLPDAYLILKLDARGSISFDQMKDQITRALQTERNQQIVKNQADQYKVQVQSPEFFANATQN